MSHPYYPTAYAPLDPTIVKDYVDLCFTCSYPLNDPRATHDRLGPGVVKVDLGMNAVNRWIASHPADWPMSWGPKPLPVDEGISLVSG